MAQLRRRVTESQRAMAKLAREEEAAKRRLRRKQDRLAAMQAAISHDSGGEHQGKQLHIGQHSDHGREEDSAQGRDPRGHRLLWRGRATAGDREDGARHRDRCVCVGARAFDIRVVLLGFLL